MEKGAQSYPGQVLAAGGTQGLGRDASCPQAGCKLPAGGMQVARWRDASCPRAGRKCPRAGQVARGQDAGGTLSCPARFLEASIRRR